MSSKIEIQDYTTYETQENDTFDLIAFRMYGNEFMASLLIQENIRHADTVVFEAGIVLNIPIIDMAEFEESLPPWRQEKES